MAKQADHLRVNRYFDSVEMNYKIDLRYWRTTSKGIRPTGRGIAVPVEKIGRLIAALQREHATHSSEIAQMDERLGRIADSRPRD